jgi:hypothetical protein
MKSEWRVESREWRVANSEQVLAQLAPAGPNRFEGKTNAGQDIVLSR